MSAVGLDSLSIRGLEKLLEQKKGVLEEAFGTELCQTIGHATIEEIPEVSASNLHLDNDNEYHQCEVTPDLLGEKTLVRGKDGSGRPFLAAKCDIFDETKKRITQVVEIIYARATANKTSYISGLQNRSLNGIVYFSLMAPKKKDTTAITNFGRLLKGEEFGFSPGFGIKVHLKIAEKV